MAKSESKSAPAQPVYVPFLWTNDIVNGALRAGIPEVVAAFNAAHAAASREYNPVEGYVYTVWQVFDVAYAVVTRDLNRLEARLAAAAAPLA